MPPGELFFRRSGSTFCPLASRDPLEKRTIRRTPFASAAGRGGRLRGFAAARGDDMNSASKKLAALSLVVVMALATVPALAGGMARDESFNLWSWVARVIERWEVAAKEGICIDPWGHTVCAPKAVQPPPLHEKEGICISSEGHTVCNH